MDLRVRLGMIPLKKEIDDLVDLMKQREQDHRKWLEELESSVRQQREFKLATDPHKCAFGKWYDTFTTDNLTLGHALKKFDQPHYGFTYVCRSPRRRFQWSVYHYRECKAK